MTHRTGIGHIPAAGAVSWSCTCGTAEVWTYAPSTPTGWAQRLMAARARVHQRAAWLADDLKESR